MQLIFFITQMLLLEEYKHVLEYEICAIMGDENAYRKNLQRMKNSNQSANKLLQNYNKFCSCREKIMTMIQCSENSKRGVLSRICMNVCSCNWNDISKARIWTVCNLTGMTTNDVVCIQHKNQQHFVHVKYYEFFVMLWLLFNVRELLSVEIETVNVQNTQSLSERVEMFFSSKKNMLEMLCNAMLHAQNYVIKSLETIG